MTYWILGILAWFACGAVGYVLVQHRYWETWCTRDRVLGLTVALLLPPMLLVVGILANINWDAPAKW